MAKLMKITKPMSPYVRMNVSHDVIEIHYTFRFNHVENWSYFLLEQVEELVLVVQVHLGFCTKNIAKGTMDPRVEFILPKSYRKFKRKS